jgi:hypothetical protein
MSQSQKRFYLMTSLALEVDEATYVRGQNLSSEELCQLIMAAAMEGRLKHLGLRPKAAVQEPGL